MAPQLPTRKLGKNGPEVTALGFGLSKFSLFLEFTTLYVQVLNLGPKARTPA
jgi:hypothetical protein